jgi:hypothetical protein
MRRWTTFLKLSQKLRTTQRDPAVVGGYGREPENYQEDPLRRVRTALAITEAA